MRRVTQNLFNVHQLRNALHGFMHRSNGHAVIFQREGNILSHRQADKLPIGILQNRTDCLGKLEQSLFLGVFTANGQAAGRFSGIGIGHKTVDAVGQSGFSAAGRPGNQYLFTFTDVQVDVVQGRLCLCGVLKAEVLKTDNRFLLEWGFLLTNKGRRLRLPLKVWYYSLLRLPALVLVAA